MAELSDFIKVGSYQKLDADQILQNADAGNIGKESIPLISNLDAVTKAGFYSDINTATSNPNGEFGTLVHQIMDDGSAASQTFESIQTKRIYTRRKASGSWDDWIEIWHDNGTGRSAASAAQVVDNAETTTTEFNSFQDPVIFSDDLNNVPPDQSKRYIVGGNVNAPFVGTGYLDSFQSSLTITAIQMAYESNGNRIFHRRNSSGWQSWNEIWHDNGTGRTAASAAQVVDNVDIGSMGKNFPSLANIGNFNNTNVSSIFSGKLADANSPSWAGATMPGVAYFGSSDRAFQIYASTNNTIGFRILDTTWNTWRELYHTGNTQNVFFENRNPSGSVNEQIFSPTNLRCARNSGGAAAQIEFFNTNGNVGGVLTNGTTTSYNTTSDPRLKTEFDKFDSQKAWNCFDKILDASGTFSFKSDLDKTIWGFDAHKLLDAGFDDIASEGEGSRDLGINDVYEKEIIPAKFEEIPELGEDGNAKLDEDGNEILVKTEVKAEEIIEKRVTPAGVDQGKIVPYLVAVIDDLRNRLEKLENN